MKEDAFILMNYLVVKKEYDYSMGAHKKYTEEEKEKKKKEYWALYQGPRTKADEARIKGFQLPNSTSKVKKKEKESFMNEVREHNQKRFEAVFNDAERWEIINSSSEKWMAKKDRQERKKKSGPGQWLTQKEVDKIEKTIWEGGDIPYEDDEPKEFVNPYKQKENE